MSFGLPGVPLGRSARIFGLFAAVLMGLELFELPLNFTFDQFAFCDAGGNLTVQYLIAHGFRPAIDFGYHYGLLPLAIMKVWFAILGTRPSAYLALMAAANLVMAWALARVAAELEFGALAVVLAAIAIGFAVQSSYPAAAQAVEACLLGLALAEHAAGRRDRALALAAAAVFAKPSMGYVYGLLLILLLTRDTRPDGRGVRGMIRAFAPAAVICVAIAVLLASMFGSREVTTTVLPLEGFRSYRALNYGFFHGSGRRLWDLNGMPWLIYLIYVAGFWIATSLFLIGSGLGAAIGPFSTSSRKDSISTRKKEFVVVCMLMHIAFVCLFFGNRWSWIYYSYVLVIGAAAAADLGSPSRVFAMLLYVLATFAWTVRIVVVDGLRHNTARTLVTAGLWARGDEQAEWSRVLEQIRNKNAVILDTKGAAELIFPGFQPPTTLYLDPGLMLDADIARKARQLATAETVVVPYGIDLEVCRGAPDTRELRQTLNQQFVPSFEGRYFEVFERRSSATARSLSSP
jgi:hypothetical protein